MWSVGCILSELLMMIKENVAEPSERTALFPGRSCFPLSAKNPEAYKDQLDQLNIIFDVIGTPKEDEISKISDEQARNYLSKLPKKNPEPLEDKFPHSQRQGIDLLRKLLQFDVEKRITVDQALNHPYLEKVRDHEAEVYTYLFSFLILLCFLLRICVNFYFIIIFFVFVLSRIAQQTTRFCLFVIFFCRNATNLKNLCLKM